MTISTPARPLAQFNLSKIVVASLAFVFGVCPPAAAQVEPIEATWMVAAREAPLRCGELSTFYKVADLQRGDVVRVDGRSSRWARVIYPVGQVGFVRNEDALDVRDGTLSVEEINAIKAPNQISGLTGSWRSIYLGKIRPGTRLTIVGQAESKDGQRVGYRVAPPMPPAVDHPPYGYVQLAALREATQSEIESHLASLKPTTAPATKPAAQPVRKPETKPEAKPEIVPAPPESTDASTNATPVTTQTVPVATDEAAPETDNAPTESAPPASETESAEFSLIDDMAVPTAEDLAPETGTPAPDDEASTQAETGAPPAVPEGGNETTQQAAEITPAKRDYLLWSELEATLTDVRRRGGAVLEDSLEELIAEYERSLANTNTPAARSALSNRLEWLRVRKAARDQRLEIQATLVQAKQLRQDVSRERTQWQAARGYDMVGRLVTSAIYDGTRLPRMYRIVTEGGTGLTRTIGYVRDDPKLNLQSLLGSVVGVAGQARLDDSLRLRVITPTSIDRFQATATP
jgi:hypothetical protein